MSVFRKLSEFSGTWLAGCLGFILLVLAAYAIRAYDFNREAARLGDFVPFTLESAMMYAYAKEAADTGKIAPNDPLLIDAKDTTVHRQMSVQLEYFLGYGYRIKSFFFPPSPAATAATAYEDNPDFTRWARFQIRLWISLSAGFLFLWARWARCPWVLSFLGGLLFAVAPFAVARGTGQDLIRENFAIPLLVAMFAFAQSYLVAPKRWKLAPVVGCAYLALISWDMCQLVFAVWLVYELSRYGLGGAVNRKRKTLWACLYVIALIAAVTSPYLREHRFVFSPTMSALFPVLTLCFWLWPKLGRKRRLAALAGLGVVFFGLWYGVFSEWGYKSNYSHFASLMKAKLRFMNVKPSDPRLLDFDARILWTPALHSATWKIFRVLFHLTAYALAVTLIVAVSLSRSRRAIRRGLGRSALPLFFAVFFFVLFIFMVRFHALAAPFICAAAAMVFADLARQPFRSARIVFPALLALLTVGELEWFLALSRDYEPGANPRYKALGENFGYLEAEKALIAWFREKPDDATVLASFPLSPMLKAYCGRRILLHPKFELGHARDNVRKYTDILYHGTCRNLNEFCVENGVKYFVFDRGLAGPMHPWSHRYHAAAMNIKPTSPVYILFADPDNARLFYRLDDAPKSPEFQQKFTVFQVISPDDYRRGAEYVKEGEKYLAAGDRTMARRLAKAAVYADPKAEATRVFYFKAFGEVPYVRLKGF